MTIDVCVTPGAQRGASLRQGGWGGGPRRNCETLVEQEEFLLICSVLAFFSFSFSFLFFFIAQGISEGLDSFPRAVITKYHQLGGLKQQKCLVSQIWRPESKLKCQQSRGLSEG